MFFVITYCAFFFLGKNSKKINTQGKNISFGESLPIYYLTMYRALLELLKQDIKPRDIMTKEAFENAITVVMALGGSTNAVLHLLAMAHAVDIPLTLDDFQTISDSTPFIADLKPSGKYVMEDIHKVMHLDVLFVCCLPILTKF